MAGTNQMRRVLGRAFRLHCPSCGQGGIFHAWFKMERRCPSCRFWFERGDGYFIGATCVNLMLAIVIPAAVILAGLLVTWPRSPWTLLEALGIALAVAVPVGFYPFARMVWLAIDLVVRPIHPTEYEREHALD